MADATDDLVLAGGRCGVSRQHGQLRPQRLPAFGLRHVIHGGEIRSRIGSHDEPGDIVKAVGRIDLVTLRGAPNADLGVLGQESVDAVSRTGKRRIGYAVLGRIPGSR